MAEMPSWQDSGRGTMKRVALWLVQVVGEGNVFTKDELRKAFDGVSQIDRRMRDLRDFEWRIDTNREDAGLDSNQQRFVKMGALVWEPGKAVRKAAEALGGAQRRAVLMRDDYHCRSCGIGNGEAYGDGFAATSQLDVARREVMLTDGETEVQFVTECNRCRVGGRNSNADLVGFLSRLNRLSPYEQRMFSAWISQDRRTFSEVEALWGIYRTMPAEARGQIRDSLL